MTTEISVMYGSEKVKCMLPQNRNPHTMRISEQLHLERKCYVLVNSANIVIPQQLMTSKVRFISSKISKLLICFALDVFDDKMWQHWY